MHSTFLGASKIQAGHEETEDNQVTDDGCVVAPSLVDALLSNIQHPVSA